MNFVATFIRGSIDRVAGYLRGLLGRLWPGRTPHIDSVAPARTYPGSVVDIMGAGFTPTLDGNTVTIGGHPARVIRAATDTLQAIVSMDAQDGPITVDTGAAILLSPVDFRAEPYPLPDSGEDGPPAYFEGVPGLRQADVAPTGTRRVLLVLVHPTDVVPPDPAVARTAVETIWADVHTYYDQISFNDLDLRIELTSTWAALLKDRLYYIDPAATVENIKEAVLPQLWAEAVRIAAFDRKNPNDFDIMGVVIYLDGAFIRAWGGFAQQNFSYFDVATGTKINFTANHVINLLAIQESADWGRCAHEAGHCFVSAPSFRDGTIGTATLGEDVYESDLVDSGAATAREFDMMGSHDHHPLFSAYHMEKLGYYAPSEILELPWDRNEFSEDHDVVAHGLTKALAAGQYRLIKIKVADGLFYYVEVRQRPGTTTQIFDDNIPIGAGANQGGVIVTKVLMDTMNNNQQTRFITLLGNPSAVMTNGQSAIDPARTLNISVVNDNVTAQPQVCTVRVAWAQGIANDPAGAFDLSVEPWNSNYESPDIWVDRPPFGMFDNPIDAEGRPTGNGDKPKLMKINEFTTRVHNQGTVDAANVLVTFYAVTPVGVGDNGNWTPLQTVTIANVGKNSFVDAKTNWVPVVGQHSCLKVFVSPQLGEITGGNNSAQENVTEFEAASSIPEPQVVPVAVRNPREEATLVYVSLQNVPAGYAVQFPHQWMMMEPLEERIVELVVVPTLGIEAYESAGARPQGGRTERSAAVRVVGTIPRSYVEEETAGRVVGSRAFPIGGVLTRVTPKHHSEIKLKPDGRYDEKHPFLGVRGVVAPAKSGQAVTVYLTDPNGKERAAQVDTDTAGEFRALFDLTATPTLAARAWPPAGVALPAPSGEIAPVPGVYKAQAFLVNAADLAESASDIVPITKSF
ncbi:IPT/TIG domain-containing protein [Nocardia sp. NPDC050710]|uniref:IPT/TIG domain-containing protein n=1 Tax=Nocardia sp. NPDC050710 TaxID=3157220 RepID=UPI0033C1000A